MSTLIKVRLKATDGYANQDGYEDDVTPAMVRQLGEHEFYVAQWPDLPHWWNHDGWHIHETWLEFLEPRP